MLSNVQIKRPTHTVVSVPNTGVLVLGENVRRFYAMIQNVSSVDMWLMLGSQGAADQGILIPKNGFSYEIDRLNLWQGEVYAIHSGAGLRNVTVLDCQ